MTEKPTSTRNEKMFPLLINPYGISIKGKNKK
jgi:hypothetical protein